MKFLPLVAALLCAVCLSCAGRGGGDKGTGDAVVVWTDRPEFALYATFFNEKESRYKAEIRYFPSPEMELARAEKGEFPDIVISGRTSRNPLAQRFYPLDRLLIKKQPRRGEVKIDKTAFYEALLERGRFNGKQYFLPVSFNLSALFFAADAPQKPVNPFIITDAETRSLAAAFNERKEGNGNGDDTTVWTKLGFSPDWSDDYIFVQSLLGGAYFRENEAASRRASQAGGEREALSLPVLWDDAALEKTLAGLNAWEREVNGGSAAVDDFVWKYFFEPAPKLVRSGRILFSYTASADFFSLPADERENLDYRWIAEDEKIPVLPEAVFLGIYKRRWGEGRGAPREASERFAAWFFNEETQRSLLDASKKTGLRESLFGIGNGFSGMQSVTEHVYPAFYPALLGHIPAADSLVSPPYLPQNWESLAATVIFPYLHEKVRAAPDSPTPRPLAERLRREPYGRVGGRE